jgi:hypothetical protein
MSAIIADSAVHFNEGISSPKTFCFQGDARYLVPCSAWSMVQGFGCILSAIVKMYMGRFAE